MKPNLLDRVKGQRKSWSQPPFWSLESSRSHFGGLTVNSDKEVIENDFSGYVQGAFKRNGAVFACMSARQLAFSEARFLWRRHSDGRPGKLFFTPDLLLLENPWPGGTTGELLGHMIQDADLAGNAYVTTTDDEGRFGKASKGGPGRRLVRMRPDYVQMILGSSSGDLTALDTKVIIYRYKVPGRERVVDLLPDEVVHFSPTPDPEARFRGMSWLTPILREIEADTQATLHKKKFFDNSAVPNLAIKFDRETSEDEFDEFVEKFNTEHKGAWNAYKTLFLMGGADITPLAYNFQQLEFNQTIGKGESRIAAAAGVPSSWVGFSEGLTGSGLNSQGVYAAARRRFADVTIRPLWRMAAASLQNILEPPAGATLWYDDRDVAFIREDLKDMAEIFRTDLESISSGITAGFKTDAMVEAARDYDLSKLIGNHTGLISVQMQSTGVPDESVDRARNLAELMAEQAKVIVSLAWPQGPFTEESAIAAVQSGDLSKLVVSDKPRANSGGGDFGSSPPEPPTPGSGGDGDGEGDDKPPVEQGDSSD